MHRVAEFFAIVAAFCLLADPASASMREMPCDIAGTGSPWHALFRCEALVVADAWHHESSSIVVKETLWGECGRVLRVASSPMNARILGGTAVCLKLGEQEAVVSGVYDAEGRRRSECRLDNYRELASARSALLTARSANECILAIRAAMATAPRSFENPSGAKVVTFDSMRDRCAAPIGRDKVAAIILDLVKSRELLPEATVGWLSDAYQADTIRDDSSVFIGRYLFELLFSPEEAVRCVADRQLSHLFSVEPLPGPVRKCIPEKSFEARVEFWRTRLFKEPQR